MVNAECDSSLRILRATATHFPLLCRFVVLLYQAIRLHRQLDRIDNPLCASLVQLCGLSDYIVLFKACSIDEACSKAIHVDLEDDDTSQPIRLQEPKLPDLESGLHVEHAELIEAIEKGFADDAELPFCSCERLFQRKRSRNSNFLIPSFIQMPGKALNATYCRLILVLVYRHTVCQFCRLKLNGKTQCPISASSMV